MKRWLMMVTALVMAGPAVADEVWTTPWGDVVYESEIGDTAVWSYQYDTKSKGYAYFPGLAGNYDNRSTHEGYWIEEGVGSCDVEIVAVDGRRSNNWGRILIIFDKPAFPTGWTALGGDCFEEPYIPLRGDWPY